MNEKNKAVTPTLKPINARLILKQREKAKWEREQASINYHKPKGFTTDLRAYRYHIGPQDVLSVHIWNHPDFNSEDSSKSGQNSGTLITVDEQGRIFYPYVGEIKVEGLTAEEAGQLLMKKLSTYLKDPQISVMVTGFNSQIVRVTGTVGSPGIVPITNIPMTILTAVSKAGGAITCKGAAIAGRCADTTHVEVTHNGRTTTVNLDTLQAANGSSSNWLLQSGDKIYVPDNTHRIFMMGAVGQQGPLNMINGKLSLKEAIGFAGGMGIGSDPTYTYIIRDFNSHPQIFVMNLRSPDALNLAGQFALKPEDIIFVSTSKIESFNQILNQFTPSLSAVAYIRSLDR